MPAPLLASLPAKLPTFKVPNFLLISVLEKDNTLRKTTFKQKTTLDYIILEHNNARVKQPASLLATSYLQGVLNFLLISVLEEDIIFFPFFIKKHSSIKIAFMFTKKTTQIGEFLTPLKFLWFESVQFVLQKSTKETKKVLFFYGK